MVCLLWGGEPMTSLVRKTAFFLAIILMTTLLWGCEQNAPDTSSATITPPSTAATTLPPETTVPTAASLSSDMFTYEAIPFPNEFATADELCLCYASQTQFILSVCSRNDAHVGIVFETDCLVLCDMEGNATVYPMDTEAYIVSAVPYDAGILYVDYIPVGDGSYAWSLIYTDNQQKTVLDTGVFFGYDHSPHLFYVEDTPYYLCEQENGYYIRQIQAFTATTVHSETGCALSTIIAECNGTEYCYLVKYPQEEYARFYVWDAEGLKYQHKLNGKIVSYTINDQYALCATGIEETKLHSMEAVDLATGEASIFGQPEPFYWHAGTGTVCVGVDNHWQPHALDTDSQKAIQIGTPNPYSKGGRSIYFESVGDNCFFVSYQPDGVGSECFYRLTISG